MPVMSKTAHAALLASIADKYALLLAGLAQRELADPREGVTAPLIEWVDPSAMCATTEDTAALRLKLSDFLVSLQQIRVVAK